MKTGTQYINEMTEIRMHGRGGNGAFTAARLLGLSAAVYEDKYAQAFPSFGPERRGAPILAFTRISNEPIFDHSQIYECDHVIVLDETLCEVTDVTAGLKEDGCLIINSKENPGAFFPGNGFKPPKRFLTIDANGIARDFLGKPIVNTVMLGAVLGAADIVSFVSLEKAIDEILPEKAREKNKAAARFAYEESVKALTNEAGI